MSPDCVRSCSRARPDVAAPPGQLESWQRLRFFEALAQAFRSAAPLVLVARRSAVGRWRHDRVAPLLSCARRPARAAWSSAPCAPRRSRTIPPLGRLLRQLERDDRADGDRARPARSRLRPPNWPAQVAEQCAGRDGAGAHVSRDRRPSALHRRARTDGSWRSSPARLRR